MVNTDFRSSKPWALVNVTQRQGRAAARVLCLQPQVPVSKSKCCAQPEPHNLAEQPGLEQ